MKYILTEEEFHVHNEAARFKTEALELGMREMREHHYNWREEHRAVIEHLFGREFGTSLDEDYIRLSKLTKQ